MDSVQLYRELVPAHALVDESVVRTWLAAAARRHDLAAWGNNYADGMVWWAAHYIQTTPGTGVGNESAEPIGLVTSQRDGDLSRTYAYPAGSTASSAEDVRLATTSYGQLYLSLRDSLAATAPTIAGPGAGLGFGLGCWGGRR